MPVPIDGNVSQQNNDVYVDYNGTIFFYERFNGFDILEWQG